MLPVGYRQQKILANLLGFFVCLLLLDAIAYHELRFLVPHTLLSAIRRTHLHPL